MKPRFSSKTSTPLRRTNELVLVHTPHLADKYQGTRMILDMLRHHSRIVPERVCIDHVEEHTIRLALEAGHWVGMTLYPDHEMHPRPGSRSGRIVCAMPTG